MVDRFYELSDNGRIRGGRVLPLEDGASSLSSYDVLGERRERERRAINNIHSSSIHLHSSSCSSKNLNIRPSSTNMFSTTSNGVLDEELQVQETGEITVAQRGEITAAQRGDLLLQPQLPDLLPAGDVESSSAKFVYARRRARMQRAANIYSIVNKIVPRPGSKRTLSTTKSTRSVNRSFSIETNLRASSRTASQKQTNPTSENLKTLSEMHSSRLQ
eukprot:GSA25T00020199001.1